MPYSTKLPFSVAQFAIKGVREGANQIHLICPAPLHLPTTQTASLSNSVFPANPFSPSRPSFPNSHVCIASSQSSVDISNSFLPSASVSLSQRVFLPFPCPFLLICNPNLQPAPVVTGNPVVDPLMPSCSTSSAQLESIRSLNSLSESFPTAATPSLTLPYKPCKPQSDWILASSSYQPRVMEVDHIFSWCTPYGISHDELLLAELPLALVESAKMSITGALAMSTRSTYAASILRFNQFSTLHSPTLSGRTLTGLRSPADFQWTLLYLAIGTIFVKFSGWSPVDFRWTLDKLLLPIRV